MNYEQAPLSSDRTLIPNGHPVNVPNGISPVPAKPIVPKPLTREQYQLLLLVSYFYFFFQFQAILTLNRDGFH